MIKNVFICHLTDKNVDIPSISSFFKQQKKPEAPLDSTNPFLEDEPGDDLGSEKGEDLAKVSPPQPDWSQTHCLGACIPLSFLNQFASDEVSANQV